MIWLSIIFRHTTTTSLAWAFLYDEVVSYPAVELGLDIPVDRASIIEMYHSSNTTEKQNGILEEFSKTNSKIRCLVGTIAFGMGVQIPDVRLVVHFGAASDIMTYHQEIGRCARDDKDGMAVMLAYPFSYSEKQATEDIRLMVK